MANPAAADQRQQLERRTCWQKPIGKSRSVCKIIILIETISNIYSHAQPQSRSTQSIRRSGRTRQFHCGGKGIEPNATCGDASGPAAGAEPPGGRRGAPRQEVLSDASG